jgi:8-oxo-dGTP diphosphatase
MKPNQFNIRVYGLLIHNNSLLVTDEFRLGICMTKFPGGALEFGEGTIDCLKREFMEELNTPIDIISHLYTTDYYQPTELLPATMQLISIYYRVTASEPFRFPTTDRVFDFKERMEGAQTFRWISLTALSEKDLTFPIDQKVAGMITSRNIPSCAH